MRLPALILLLPMLVSAVEHKPGPAPAPSAAELQALELLNDFRADVGRAQTSIVRLMRVKAIPAQPNQWAITMGSQKAAPPLVVNPSLMLAARALLAGTVAPVDRQPMDFAAVFTDAAYAPNLTGQVLMARNALSLPVAFAAAVTHPISEKTPKPDRPTYHYPIYDAAGAVDPAWREVGIAVTVGKNGVCSLAIVLGAGSAKRYVGGVVYADANHNGHYDDEEGQTGVQVSVGDITMTTGAGGAWWLALPDDHAVEVIFSGSGHRGVRPVVQGTTNVNIDWRVPNTADIKLVDRLIVDAEKDPAADPAKRRKPLAALLAGARNAVLDDARQAKVTALTQPIQAEFDDLLRQSLAALAEEPGEFKDHMVKMKKPWENNLSRFFKELDALYALHQQVITVLAAPVDRQAVLAPPVIKQVEKACGDSSDPAFIAQLEAWRSSLADTLPVEAKPEVKPR